MENNYKLRINQIQSFDKNGFSKEVEKTKDNPD